MTDDDCFAYLISGGEEIPTPPVADLPQEPEPEPTPEPTPEPEPEPPSDFDRPDVVEGS